MDIYERSLERHRETRGKIATHSRMELACQEDLSIAYTPGVARPCEVIAADPDQAFDLTWRGRTVAVVSDGSLVLGLGDIGPVASLPVMEGKAALFREFAGVDAVPLVIDERDPARFVAIVRAIAGTYGGINLEDIAAPRCFEIEASLQDIGIPVLHDDQHGTAIVLLAAIINAARATKRKLRDLDVVISGAGAAGVAITRFLSCLGDFDRCTPVKSVVLCDSKGIVHAGRQDNDPSKERLAAISNPNGRRGSLRDALRGADVFIGVSRGNLLKAEDIQLMNPGSIVLAMANPIPEIMPDEARRGGAAVVGTGRSDFPNQVNNVLAFPGLFRGALDARATRFNDAMKWAAVEAIVESVPEPTAGRILPEAFDRSVARSVAKRVHEMASVTGVARRSR